jgi:hypothetical protein
LAVTVPDVAIPLVLVWTLVVGDPPNVALAPLPGAVNVTVAPLTGFELASVTVACSAVPKAVLTDVLCPLPAVLAMANGGPAIFVRLKLAGALAPGVLAVTV